MPITNLFEIVVIEHLIVGIGILKEVYGMLLNGFNELPLVSNKPIKLLSKHATA
jgi:hypothetical protein